MSKALQRWEDRIALYHNGSPIPKSIIGAGAKVLRDADGKVDPVADLLLDCLKYGALKNGWRITAPQVEQGVDWLREQGPKSHDMADAYRMFMGFRFMGYSVQRLKPETLGGRLHVAPVYRVLKADLTWLDYAPDPWQTCTKMGPPFRIVGRSSDHAMHPFSSECGCPACEKVLSYASDGV